MNTTYIDISGSVLSSLFYDCVSCPTDQEGFLFGEVVTRVTGVISDSQINSEKEEIVISLKNHKQCSQPHSFYDSTGKVDESILKELLGSGTEELIGWYRCRRHSTLSVFTRERTIHRNISRLIPVEKRPFFVLGLFCTDDNQMTYAFDQAFHCYNGRTFRTVLKSVVNLGDTSQSEYRMHRQLSTSCRGNFYGHLMSQFSNPANSNRDAVSNHIHQIQHSLQKGLRELANQVAATESIRQQLTAATESLRSQLLSRTSKSTEEETAQSSNAESLVDTTETASLTKSPSSTARAPRDLSCAELGLQRVRKPALLIAGPGDPETFNSETLF